MLTGKEIRKARKAKKLTQEELADLVGVSRSAVYDWERGKYSPTGERAVRLAKTLGLSPTAFFPASLLNSNNQHEPPEMGATRISLPEGAKLFSPDEWYPVPLLDPTAIVCAGEGNGGMHGVMLEAGKNLVLPREWIGVISVDADKKPFAIRVEGESMTEAGIPDGSEIVVNPAEEIRDGDVCLTCYGVRGDWAVKWVHFHPDGSIELRASSPKYPPKRFSREDVENGLLKVIGKVTFVKVVPKRNE